MDIKRNNPGNIKKYKDTWQGELPGATEGVIISFDTLDNGSRALLKDLNTKVSRGLNTISKIIPVFDPTAPAGYIPFVSDKSRLNKDTVIKPGDFDTLANVAYAMTFFEHGIQQDDGTLTAAFSKAKQLLQGAAAAVTSNWPVVIVLGLGLWWLTRK